MAIDNKYGRVTFEEPNTIGEDEPVIVFRAADPLLVELLADYERRCKGARSPLLHLAAIREAQAKVMKWQAKNPELVREKPTSSNWDGESRG